MMQEHWITVTRDGQDVGKLPAQGMPTLRWGWMPGGPSMPLLICGSSPQRTEGNRGTRTKWIWLALQERMLIASLGMDGYMVARGIDQQLRSAGRDQRGGRRNSRPPLTSGLFVKLTTGLIRYLEKAGRTSSMQLRCKASRNRRASENRLNEARHYCRPEGMPLGLRGELPACGKTNW